MAVKSIFEIKCCKDLKVWVEQSVYIKIYRNQRTFFKISPPLCAGKSFCLYMCYHILHIVWKWLAGTRGKDVQQPKNPGPKPIKCIPNKKLMTVMKFSRTSLLNYFVYCVLLSEAQWDTFIPSKVLISFVELSVFYYLRYM